MTASGRLALDLPMMGSPISDRHMKTEAKMSVDASLSAEMPSKAETRKTADPRRFSVGITGITCASCVARVEKAIGAVLGIDQFSVNLATEQATIVAPPTVKPVAIVDAIE